MAIAAPPLVAPLESAATDVDGLLLHGPGGEPWSEEGFFALCSANRKLKIERTHHGDALIMPPAGLESDGQNTEFTGQLRNWARRDGSGQVFGPTAAFTLPDGSTLCPDGSWVRKDKLNALTRAQITRFPPLVPDFVLEVRSPSDRLRILQQKMQRYIDNGVPLAWLLNSADREVWVYRPCQEPQQLSGVATVSGDPELPGFTLDLTLIWDVDA